MGDLLYQLILELDPGLADAASGWLFEQGVDGIEEQPADDRVRLVVYSPDQAALEALGARAREQHAGATVVVQQLALLTWQTEWTKHLGPAPVGDSFVLQPIWDQTPPPPGREVLYLQPRLAFGVGSHATTRLAATSVERYCRAHPGCRVLDVGTGTGVLAMVALRSGAGSVEAIDVDPVAVDAAAANLALNQLGDRCQVSLRPLAAAAAPFDLVVANLEAPVLLELARELTRNVDEAGTLAVSGVMLDRADEVTRALGAGGLAARRRDELEAWALIELGRS